ncbi:hypothetical protein LTR86_002957 [Recurvomyces mirabilis]|nr:hypothetical protein LTR86_002957 [Recurvomyces mirabilis]
MSRMLRAANLLVWLANIISLPHATADNNDTSDISGAASAVATTSTTDGSLIQSGFAPTGAGSSTCMSGTVNYITHTLPQQCLRTDRSFATTNVSLPAANTTGLTAGLPVATPSVNGSWTTDGDQQANSVNEEGSVELTATVSSSTSPTISSAESGQSDSPSIEGGDSDETDPLLDSVSFLSFEDWKKQNLAKTGQSPDNVGQERQSTGQQIRPVNALDTLGEESEIDLDFSGFGTGGSAKEEHDSSRTTSEFAKDSSMTDSPNDPTPASLRSRDAGKTCKERTNYASFDCAANILKNNKECKHASSILVENKDSYMLNKCSANNKFLIVELCNDIHIDTIVLANYEFFSSSFRHFRSSVSDRYPVKEEKWKQLGTFEARNTREVQAFLIEEPQIWARYLRIEFLTHYGSEYYCPISLLRVHGKTMMQEFRQEEEMARGELSDDDTSFETVRSEILELSVSIPSEEAITAESVLEIKTLDVETMISLPDITVVANEHNATSQGEHTPTTTTVLDDIIAATDSVTCAASMTLESIVPTIEQHVASEDTNVAALAESNTTVPAVPTTDAQVSNTSSSVTTTQTASIIDKATASNDFSSQTALNDSIPTVLPPRADVSASASTDTSASSQTDVTISSTLAAASDYGNNTTTNSTRSAASSTSTTSQAPAQPSSQESFFKSISKRLQQLESNSTLSLQYIEEQSRILREAFNKVEKRQVTATSNFLTTLNSTVMTELQGFRQAYDQLWQSTVIELEGQRAQYQREMLALSTRLTLVADELVWQKRMGIVQSTLLLLCLGLVLFARQGNGVVDMTLAQSLVNRSQAALKVGWESDPASPSSPASRSPVSVLRRRIWRSSTEPVSNVASEDDIRPQTRDGDAGLDIEVEPPTPPRENGVGNGADEGSEEEGSDVEYQPVRSHSSPAVPVKLNGGAANGVSSRPGSPLRYS